MKNPFAKKNIIELLPNCISMTPAFIVSPSTFSNIFSSKTTGPIELKFHIETPWDAGTKVCSNGPGHMIKMATTPIYGITLLKPEGR